MTDWHEVFLDRMQNDRDFCVEVLKGIENVIVLCADMPVDEDNKEGVSSIAMEFISLIDEAVNGEAYEGEDDADNTN